LGRGSPRERRVSWKTIVIVSQASKEKAEALTIIGTGPVTCRETSQQAITKKGKVKRAPPKGQKKKRKPNLG